jgi:hypothetical protein
MMCIPSFIKIGSGIQKLIGGDTHTHRHTHKEHGVLIGVLLFFQNKESRLIENENNLPPCSGSISQIEITSSFESLVSDYQTMGHSPQDHCMNHRHREGLRSRVFL